MTHFLKWMESFLRTLFGLAVLPVTLVCLLAKAGIKEYNFSGILNLKGYRTIMIFICAAAFIWICRCFYLLRNRMQHPYLLAAFACCLAGGLVFPYEEGSSASSTLHLVFSYGGFCLFTVFLYLVCENGTQRTCLNAVLLLFLFICILDQHISGPAELVYACGCSILLAWLCRNK